MRAIACGPLNTCHPDRYRVSPVAPSRLEALGDVRLFGIEAVGKWQALLYGVSEGWVVNLAEQVLPTDSLVSGGSSLASRCATVGQ